MHRRPSIRLFKDSRRRGRPFKELFLDRTATSTSATSYVEKGPSKGSLKKEDLSKVQLYAICTKM